MEEEDRDAAVERFRSELFPWFQDRGYAYWRTEELFARVEGDMSWRFGLGLSVYPDCFETRPMASIRHEQVERIFHHVSGASESVQKGSVTVPWGRAVERRTPKPNSFTVERGGQAQRAVAFTEHFFTKWVEPFFREHSDLKAISNSFNHNRAILRAKHFIDWFDLLGGALISAKLARRDDYDDLKQVYRRAFATRQTSHSLSSFDTLIEVLEKEA
jgi:hypothetical protein